MKVVSFCLHVGVAAHPQEARRDVIAAGPALIEVATRRPNAPLLSTCPEVVEIVLTYENAAESLRLSQFC
jgi:hypothetical protein